LSSEPEPVRVATDRTTFAQAFAMADDVLYEVSAPLPILIVTPD